MDYCIQILTLLNVPQIIAIGIMFWVFYNRLYKKIDRLAQRMDRFEQRMDRFEQRMDRFMDRFDEKLTDIDRRFCRMEGAFATKDFCMLKDEKIKKKAE
jgi:DNA anti-recombination protein RmuC